jgi:hypothetical protein
VATTHTRAACSSRAARAQELLRGEIHRLGLERLAAAVLMLVAATA